jgi:hypothetical protein
MVRGIGTIGLMLVGAQMAFADVDCACLGDCTIQQQRAQTDPWEANAADDLGIDSFCVDPNDRQSSYWVSALPSATEAQLNVARITLDSSAGLLTASALDGTPLHVHFLADNSQPASGNLDADYLARRSGPGVFYWDNFLDSSTDELRERNWVLSGSGARVPKSSNLHLDTSIKLSGNGSLRIHVTTQGSKNQGNFRHSFVMPHDNHDQSVKKTAFYYQVAIYTDSYLLADLLGAGRRSRGNKLLIIAKADQSDAKADTVVTNRFFSGYVTGYVHESAIRHFLVDETTSPVQWNSDGWTVVEMYQDLTAGEVRLWAAAHYGDAPQLIASRKSLRIHSNSRYTGAQLTNYDTQGWLILPSGDGPRSFDGQNYWTFHCWDEVIASDDWIPFPGHLGGTEP